MKHSPEDKRPLGMPVEQPNVCTGCGHEVDPEVCWCGDEISKHNPMNDGHNPVPMGCTCGYAK